MMHVAVAIGHYGTVQLYHGVNSERSFSGPLLGDSDDGSHSAFNHTVKLDTTFVKLDPHESASEIHSHRDRQSLRQTVIVGFSLCSFVSAELQHQTWDRQSVFIDLLQKYTQDKGEASRHPQKDHHQVITIKKSCWSKTTIGSLHQALGRKLRGTGARQKSCVGQWYRLSGQIVHTWRIFDNGSFKTSEQYVAYLRLLWERRGNSRGKLWGKWLLSGAAWSSATFLTVTSRGRVISPAQTFTQQPHRLRAPTKLEVQWTSRLGLIRGAQTLHTITTFFEGTSLTWWPLL